MLVLDPKKRYTINQIRNHRWMCADGGYQEEKPRPHILGQNAKSGEINEQILKLMQGLGIDQQKTIEVRNETFVHE